MNLGFRRLFLQSVLMAGFFFLMSARAHAADLKTITQVEVNGMSNLRDQELQSVLELGPGDSFDDRRAKSSVSNLAELYKYRGFPRVDIKSSFDEKAGVWILKINEGYPYRVKSVEMISTVPLASGDLLQWNRLQGHFLERFSISRNDIFDQERISVGVRAVQSLLINDEYIGASVSEVLVEQQVAPSEKVAPPLAAGWVSLKVRVHLGERVSFGFRGNQFFSRNELLSFVKEQRALGLGKNYLETLSARFREAYISAGFRSPQIQAYPVELGNFRGRHVTWIINEGSRSRFNLIEFDGAVSFSQQELEKLFRDGMSSLLKSGVYVEKDLARSAEVFIKTLKSKGYLGARLIGVQYQWDESQTKADVLIFFHEGVQTLVDSIQILGSEILSVDEAASILGVKRGEPLNVFRFSDGVQRIKSFFRNRGFLEVGIFDEGGSSLITYRDENRRADIRIQFEPGRQYRAGSISVEGRLKTRLDVIFRELGFKEGDLLTEDAVLGGESRLRRLGLFSSAQIRLEEDTENPGIKKVHVLLQEGTPGLIAGGVGFRNDLGFRAFGQTSYTNLFGRNHTVVLDLNVNRRFIDRRVPLESQAQLGYVWPWLFVPELIFRPSITFQRTQYERFDALSLVLGSSFEKRLLKRPNLLASINYNLERTEQNAVDAQSIDNQTITIGGVTGSLKLDLRNDRLAPTQGFYSALSYEIADPIFLSQKEPFPIGYTRLQFRADYLFPVWKEASWYFSFRTGLERNTQDISDPRVAIPLIKQFTLGGVGSLRGFREQELNVQDISIRGTASYVNYRAQFDLPLSGPMRFGPFFDAANLLVDDYSLRRNLRMGTGMGLHYLTPVGPVNFDMGFKIDPRPGEDPYRFYFSIGVI